MNILSPNILQYDAILKKEANELELGPAMWPGDKGYNVRLFKDLKEL